MVLLSWGCTLEVEVEVRRQLSSMDGGDAWRTLCPKERWGAAAKTLPAAMQTLSECRGFLLQSRILVPEEEVLRFKIEREYVDLLS